MQPVVRITTVTGSYFDIAYSNNNFDFPRFVNEIKAFGGITAGMIHIPYISIAAIIWFPEGAPEQEKPPVIIQGGKGGVFN